MNQVSGYGLTKDGKNQYPMPSIQSKMNTKSTSTLVFAIFSLLCTASFAQFHHYADSRTHARGIAGFKNSIYLSANTGLVYEHNIKTNKSRCLNLNSPLHELRDIDVNGQKVIAMQSSKASQLTYILNGFAMRMRADYKDVFYDGMALYAMKGMLYGDPIDGVFPVYTTNSGGVRWTPVKTPLVALEGEYGFSASGTSIIYKDEMFVIVTGGQSSRFIKTEDLGKPWFTAKLPFESRASSGAYSVAMKNTSEGVVVGGNYKKPEDDTKNCFYTLDGGKTWKAPTTKPRGYRSCIIEHKGVYYACGTTGIDYSVDNGVNWSPLTSGKFYTMTVLKNKLYASATEGRIAKFKLRK